MSKIAREEVLSLLGTFYRVGGIQVAVVLAGRSLTFGDQRDPEEELDRILTDG